jgi:hypothetical protein
VKTSVDVIYLIGSKLFSLSIMGYVVGFIAWKGGLEPVGEFSSIVALLAPIAMFSVLRYPEWIALADDKMGALSTVLISSQLLYGFGATVLVLAVAVLGGISLEQFLLLAVFKSLEIVNDQLGAYYSAAQLHRRAIASNALKLAGLLFLTNVVFDIEPTSVVTTVAYSLVCGHFFVLVIYDGPTLKRLGRPPATQIQSFLATQYQFGFSNALTSVNSNMPRYFLMAMSSKTLLGIFSIIYLVSATLVNVFQFPVSIKVERIKQALLSGPHHAQSLFFFVLISVLGFLSIAALWSGSGGFLYYFLACVAMSLALMLRGVGVSLEVGFGEASTLNRYLIFGMLGASLIVAIATHMVSESQYLMLAICYVIVSTSIVSYLTFKRWF